MALISPPAGLRLRAAGHWRLATSTGTPGRGLDGRQQFLRRENRIWVNDYLVLDCWTRAGLGRYLAFLDQLHGPANSFLLPVCNRALAAPGEVLFVTEGGEFATESGDFLTVGAVRDVAVTAAATAGAAVVTVSALDAYLMEPGVVFSHAGWLHRVASRSGGTIRFNPPLRAGIAEAAVLSLDAPQIRVRLADDAAAEEAHAVGEIGGPHVLRVEEAFER